MTHISEIGHTTTVVLGDSLYLHGINEILVLVTDLVSFSA